MRWRFIILIGVCLTGAVSSFKATAGTATAGSVNSGDYTTRTVKLDDDDYDRDRVGRLEWRGGFEITSTDSRLGLS